MPTDDDLNANTPEPAIENDPPVAAPPPNVSLSRDELRNIMRAAIDETLNERGSNRPAPQVEPEPEGFTEEEYESLSPQQRALVQKAIKRELHSVKKEMNQFREFGLARLGELTESNMRTQLPYYTKYEGEIKAELNRLNPALRTDPTTIRIVHDSVAMRHESERIEDAKKEAARQARGDAPAPATSGPMRGAPLPKGVPSPEDLGFNAMQLDEIERAGGPDAFAQKVSDGRMKDWKTYAASFEKMNTAPKQRGRQVIPFARLEPKRNRIENSNA